MIIIHGVKTLPRLVGSALAERLRVMPATVVTGARQTGKSTLAEQLVTGKRRYVSLDDLEVLDARDDDWRDVLAAGTDIPEDWRVLARHGGFPTPAVELTKPSERAVWFDGYIRTYLERDLQDLAAIS